MLQYKLPAPISPFFFLLFDSSGRFAPIAHFLEFYVPPTVQLVRLCFPARFFPMLPPDPLMSFPCASLPLLSAIQTRPDGSVLLVRRSQLLLLVVVSSFLGPPRIPRVVFCFLSVEDRFDSIQGTLPGQLFDRPSSF